MQPWREAFSPGTLEILLGYTVACLGGIILTADILIIRHFTYFNTVENQHIVLFWLYITGACTSGIMSLCIEDITFPSLTSDWLLIGGHCISYSLYMSLYMFACANVHGVVMTLIWCTNIVYLTIAQYTFLSVGHGGNRNWLELTGIVMVTIGSVLPSICNACHRQK